MGAPEQSTGRRSGVRLDVHGRGSASVETGLPVLNSLVARLAEVARFDLQLELEPRDPAAEVDAAGAALGDALAGPLRAPGAQGWGAGSLTSAEALAHVALEVSDEPLLVSNVDLTEARIGGLGTDVVRSFLEQVARQAGLVLHVRLLNGTDTGHVLEAIFKALGAALSEACRPRGGAP
jgi:imidazoleglycerol-phosphate dehydratase